MVIANLEPIIARVQLELLPPIFITLPLSTVNCICCFNLQSLRIMRSRCTSARTVLISTTPNNAVASADLVVSAFALLKHHNSLPRCQHNCPCEPFLPPNPSPCCVPFKPKPFYFMTVQFLHKPLVRNLIKRVLEISACYISCITLRHMLVDSFKEFKSVCES